MGSEFSTIENEGMIPSLDAELENFERDLDKLRKRCLKISWKLSVKERNMINGYLFRYIDTKVRGKSVLEILYMCISDSTDEYVLKSGINRKRLNRVAISKVQREEMFSLEKYDGDGFFGENDENDEIDTEIVDVENLYMSLLVRISSCVRWEKIFLILLCMEQWRRGLKDIENLVNVPNEMESPNSDVTETSSFSLVSPLIATPMFHELRALSREPPSSPPQYPSDTISLLPPLELEVNKMNPNVIRYIEKGFIRESENEASRDVMSKFLSQRNGWSEGVIERVDEVD